MASRIHSHIIGVMPMAYIHFIYFLIVCCLEKWQFPNEAVKLYQAREDKCNLFLQKDDLWPRHYHGSRSDKKITLPSGCRLHSNTRIDFLMPPWMTVTDVPFRKYIKDWDYRNIPFQMFKPRLFICKHTTRQTLIPVEVLWSCGLKILLPFNSH